MIYIKNKRKKTAEDLFAEANKKLLDGAREWIKRTAEQCSLLGVFIATVAYAAAYTIPGGPNELTGFPILLNQPFFLTFAISDVLSLTSALTSVIMFLSILASPFRLFAFKQSLLQKLKLGIMLLMLSVSMMMLAFAATVILMIDRREQWTKIALYTASFLPVSIFAVSQVHLFSLLTTTFDYPLKKFGGYIYGKFIKSSWVRSASLSIHESKTQPTPPPPHRQV